MGIASTIIVIATAIFCIIAGYELISYYIKNRKKEESKDYNILKYEDLEELLLKPANHRVLHNQLEFIKNTTLELKPNYLYKLYIRSEVGKGEFVSVCTEFKTMLKLKDTFETFEYERQIIILKK